MSTIDRAEPAAAAQTVQPAVSTGNSGHDVVAAAAALVPALRARAAQTDALSKLPDATVADLQNARLFDMVRPKMYGGLQVSYETYLDAIIEVARGDAATAWTLGLISTGIWLVAVSYPKQVADQVFGQNANVRICGTLAPRKAKTRRVAGGYVIEDGLWMYNTGVYHAQWDQLGIPLVDDAGQVIGRGAALLPVSEITLLNDWDTIGLRGSGSTSVTVKDVFVPDERIVSTSRTLQDDYAATHLRDGLPYRMPMVPTLAIRLVCSMVGMARAAVELFMEKIGTRGIAFTTYGKQDDATVTHLQIGEATAKIDAAESILRQAIRLLETSTERGEKMSVQQRARIWRDAGFASRLIWEGVDQIAGASGTAFINRDAPMNRVWRDVRVAYMHGAIYHDTCYEIYGRAAAGKTPITFLLPELE
ncbi:acyl-CoA dehydrogenase family protein [Paraburkholderia rhizosphaerae]|uniref:Alkylation response protein AidB-like acyl-CoA dehydrogenase n=1 Tax=Paraburkholderia rhizosphaerae TaxID=480658 RepID=A0A4R8LMP1_9BURK|nr:acyl-CoA dehydrogenase family protein [Paraburkholderia rhizosphaerae]TDY44488.1 alkylation response protein AidB-like acyl-CoA dehydrogenase [Paraburkholderia rhizosphaerae]